MNEIARVGEIARRVLDARDDHDRLRELEAVMANIPDGVYVGDSSGVRYANRPAVEMLGYETVEALNRDVATLMGELDVRDASGRLLAVDENVFVRALAGESGCMDVYVLHRQSKRRCILRSSAAPLRVDGQIVGAVALNVDVTELRTTERELRVQRALAMLERDVLSLLAERTPLEEVFHALASGLEAFAPGMLASVLTIEDGRIRHVAAPSLPPAWCAAIENKTIGPKAGSCGTAAYRRQRVIVSDIASDPLWDDYRAGALSFGLRACWSHPIIATDGDVLGTVALYYREPRTPTDDELASIEGTARVARIVLERHRDDCARDRLVNELRETLQHNELLIGVLGHDLRSPMSAVMMGTQLVLSQESDLQKRRVLERVAVSSARMSRMIAQLLDLTRARIGGGMPLTRRPIDLESLALAIASEVQAAAPQRRLVVEITGNTRGEWDEDRLGQVLSNLLSNAIQHGRAGDVRLRVSGDDEHTVQIDVHSQGVIPAERIPSLFDPFRRGPHRTSVSEGLGLGLYIVKQVVHAHRGQIEVHSTPASGTSFQISLPRVSFEGRPHPR
jgi:PAS domain S-box-containing protein